MMVYRRFSRKFVGSALKVELSRCLGSVSATSIATMQVPSAILHHN